jgi:hypothetical protein
MLHRSAGAAAIIALFIGTVRGQILGDSPSTGNAAWAYGVAVSHDPERVWREQDAERKYRDAIKKIPDKKPSTNDPWKGVRQESTTSSTASSSDRHRAQ